MADPTIYPDLNAVLRELVESAQAILGESFCGKVENLFTEIRLSASITPRMSASVPLHEMWHGG